MHWELTQFARAIRCKFYFLYGVVYFVQLDHFCTLHNFLTCAIADSGRRFRTRIRYCSSVPLQSPSVTVGVPLYHGATFITEAIKSIQDGTYSNWEILVIDDGSLDSSSRCVDSFNDPRIRMLQHPTNRGLVFTRNEILDKAKGRYLAWLDQDDFQHPERLTRQVEYLESHPNISLLSSWTDVLVQGTNDGDYSYTKLMPTRHEEIRAQMLFTNPVSCNTVMMRRNDFANLGLAFREYFGNTLDYDLWSRASDTLQFSGIEESLCTYRVHPNQTSRGTELTRMGDQALQVQLDLIERTLQISVSARQSETHRKISQPAFIGLQSSDLTDVLAWLSILRRQNLVLRAFDGKSLDRVLVLQWLSVLRSLSRTDSSLTFKHTWQGIRHIGIAPLDLVGAIRQGMRRRRLRR